MTRTREKSVSAGVMRSVIATALYGALHTALASETAKGAVERIIGTRRRNALYRPAFNLVAVVSTLGLIAYVWRQPDRPLYRVRGPIAWLMRAGQLAGAAALGWTALSQDTLGFLGLPSLWAYLTRQPRVPPEPASQGPSLDRSGHVAAAGPFAHLRQPANMAFVPILWLNPTMSVKGVAFSAAVTAYAVLGSLHAERLLRDAHGQAYRRYQQRVPMLVPSLHRHRQFE